MAKQARVQRAANGTDRYLVLRQGYRYEGPSGQAGYQVLRFAEYAIRLDPPAVRPGKEWDATPSADLLRDDSLQARSELHVRLSRPVTVLVLALVAVPLARFRPGASRFYPLWMGMLVFALYFNLLGTGQLWIELGQAPAWAGLWWVHVLIPGLVFLAGFLARMNPLKRVTA